jgi:TonB family protein
MIDVAAPAASEPRSASGRRDGLLAFGLGTGATLALFLGLALFDHEAPPPPPPEVIDLRAVVVDRPPPLPPREPTEPVPLEAALRDIAPTPSASPVEITITPPDLETLLPPQLAPPAVIQVAPLYRDLQPRLDLAPPADYVFQMGDVDRLPEVLNRVAPRVPPALTSRIQVPRVTLMFVVDAVGAVQNLRVIGTCGNAEVDEIVRKSVLEWSFAPAVRRGRPVACLLQQAMVLKISAAPKFEI